MDNSKENTDTINIDKENVIRDNFRENVKEEVPNTTIEEIVKPINKNYKRESLNYKLNKISHQKKMLENRRSHNKAARKTRKRNKRGY